MSDMVSVITDTSNHQKALTARDCLLMADGRGISFSFDASLMGESDTVVGSTPSEPEWCNKLMPWAFCHLNHLSLNCHPGDLTIIGSIHFKCSEIHLGNCSMFPETI